MMDTAAESTAPHRDEELLGELMRQLASAASVETVLEDFCKRYPHLEAEARSYPRIQQALQGVQPAANAHPKQLGDFRIIRQMARGGMGVIYEAIQERLKRRVVLKTMKANRDVGPTRLRFRREQEVLAQLHQTHIVPIHTADEAEGLHYFVMPYIDGASLNHVVEEARHYETSQAQGATTSLPAIAAAWLKKSNNHEVTPAPSSGKTADPSLAPSATKLPKTSRELPMHYFHSVAQAMADVAEGLHYAHQEGLLHRDLKPSNVMIEPNGKCWIIDFGLAGFLHQSEAIDSSTSAEDEGQSLTHGQTIGTPAYMAPEQWKDTDKLDVRTDVWGLGTTLYELLTLQRAFKTSSKPDSATQKQELRLLIEAESPRPVTEYVSNVPPDLVAICNKAMQKDPEKRYATAQAFAEDLQHWLRREPTKALPGIDRAVWLWAKRNTGWAAAIGLGLATLVALVVGLGALNAQKEELVENQKQINAQQAEELRSREREAILHEQQEIRLLQHEAGWSDRTGELLAKASKIRKDEILRDHVVASLVGMDVKINKRFELGASSVAFDPQGKRLLIGGLSQPGPVTKARLWDGTSPAPVAFELQLDGPVAFDAKGNPLQAGLADNWTLNVWDVSRNRSVATFKHEKSNNTDPIYNNDPHCALSPDGMLAALYSPIDSTNGILTAWDIASQKPLLVHRGHITSVRFSSSRSGVTILAAGTKQGRVILWELPAGRKITELDASASDIQSVAFGRDVRRFSEEVVPSHASLSGMLLATGAHSGEITVWRPAFEKLVNTFRGSQYDIYALAFTPDGATLASGGRSEIRLWDVATARPLIVAKRNPYSDATQYLGAMDFSSDGRRLAVGNYGTFDDGKIRAVLVLDIMENRGVRLLRGLDSACANVLYSPQGKYIAALSETWQAGIWDAETGQLLHLFDVPVGLFTDNVGMAFSQDDSQFAFLGGGQAKRWETASGKLLNHWKDLPPAIQERIVFHPSGALLCGRSETQGKKYPPTSDYPFEQHPRVYRVRNLLQKDYAQPLYEVDDFKLHIQDGFFGTDGTYLLIYGLHGTRERPIHCYRAIDALNRKLLWEKDELNRRKNHSAGFLSNPDGSLVWMEVPDVPRQGGAYALLDTRAWKISKEDSIRTSSFFGDGKLRNLIQDNEISIALFQTDSVNKTFKIPVDRRLRGAGSGFDKTGQFLVFGTYTSEVIQINLPEIRRRLQEAGFAWPLDR